MSEATQSSTSDAARRGGLAFVTSRPVAITMFMIAIAVFGLVSLKRLPMDLLPEISYPTLTVRTAWPGAAPEDIEDRVSVRIQESLATLPNLVRTSSVSRAGYSDVVLEYQWGADMTFAVQDVRDKLDSLFLPSGSERPIILRYDPNLDPTLRIGVSAPPGAARGTDSELIQLRWIAENKLKRELETMAGVAAVQVRGGLEEEVRVRVDPKKLEARSIDLSSIAQRLAAENLNASGGAILEGSTSFLVRTLNEFEDLTDIEQLPIVRRGETSVRLGEVATVERTYKKREVVTRLGDSEAVEIAVYREAGANIVEVADNVKLAIFGTDEQRAHTAELVEKGEDRAGGGRFEDRGKENYLAWRLRREATIEVLSDQSNFIRSAIDDVRSSAIIGAVLAVVVMWFFLRRLSTTVIVALAIPISVIVTFAPMFRAGVSLNIMSLGGLALGIGMLVDNAIVVLESITRCREEGDGLRDAALRGVREVSGAIVASTLTTVAVFAPIVFVHGIAGQIFGDQALTVVSSLLVSLLVAVLFIPMLASRPFLAGGLPAAATARPPLPYAGLAWSWSTGVADVLTVVGRAVLWILAGATMVGLYLFGLIGRVVYWATWPFRALFDLGWGALERGYPLALRASLRHPIVVLLATGVLGWAAFARVGDLGLELLPEIHQGEFTAHVGLSVDSPLANTDRVLRDLAREVGALDEVALTALITGVEADTLTRDIEGEHTGRMTVRLAPGTDAAGEDEVLTRVRRILESHPEVRSVDVSRPTPFVIDAPLAVEVTGHDLDRMGEIASEVEARISALRDLTDVRSTMRVGHPEARVVFDREKTLEYGLDLGTVSNLLRSQLLGEVSTRLTDGDDRIDIRVQGDEAYLATLEEVLELSVNPESPRPLPLSSVARVELVRGPAEIRRIGNSRAVVVSASGTGLDLGGLNAEIEDSLAGLETPDDIFVELGGQKRELDAGRTSMIAALLLAIFLVYVVMASQFESLVQPLIIMLTVPLAGVGVVFTLDLLGIPLSVIVFIGAILLAGIVVNNAIVLVDRINQQRRAGMPLHESIEEAGRARLRPILMTTLTTALGLLPLTGWLDGLPLLDQLATGAGSEIRAPMAITVIAGLASSTALTLVLIPVVYSIVYRQAHRGEVAP
ncbi:MAG: efflux RND transporter permease subunit [Planctomycetes bacterium]|nr:efflux RND transporter permease subunit [Planctomycetota bacterium]